MCRCTTGVPAEHGTEPSPLFVSFPIGYADTAATYHFVDLWSRQSTWGGGPLPVEGDSIVVPFNTTILLDIPAGQLPMLHTVILFGDLVFDDTPVAGAEPAYDLQVCLSSTGKVWQAVHITQSPQQSDHFWSCA